MLHALPLVLPTLAGRVTTTLSVHTCAHTQLCPKQPVFPHPSLPPSLQSTVKKAMSEFKRTHYDNWRDHKQKFTEDQLVIVNDLLVSPSYYA